MKRRKMQQENIFSTSGSKWEHHWISTREPSTIFLLWVCIAGLKNKIIANAKTALKIYIYLLQQFHMFIQISWMLLQYSVSTIYSYCSEFLKVTVVPICLCQGSPSVQGTVAQTSDRACDRQAPQSFAQRTELVRNPKITILVWKMEKGWDLFGWATQRVHLPLWSLEERLSLTFLLLPFSSTNLFPCPRLPNKALWWCGKGKTPMTGRTQLKAFLWGCHQVQHLQNTVRTRGFPSFSKVSELKAKGEEDQSL